MDFAALAAIAPWKHGVVAVVALAGGFVNSIAGGGSLLTFPTLIWVGIPPVTASATNTVGLWAGSLGGVVGFRRHLPERSVIVLLGVPSLLGGIIGAVLLLRTPQNAAQCAHRSNRSDTRVTAAAAIGERNHPPSRSS